jgi:hypothetical protein
VGDVCSALEGVVGIEVGEFHGLVPHRVVGEEAFFKDTDLLGVS